MTTKQIHKLSVNVSMLVPLKGDSSTAETLLQEDNHLSVPQTTLRFGGKVPLQYQAENCTKLRASVKMKTCTALFCLAQLLGFLPRVIPSTLDDLHLVRCLRTISEQYLPETQTIAVVLS